MPDTQYFNTFSAGETPNNPPVFCCKYETAAWAFTRINDSSYTQLMKDLKAVPPPRILNESGNEASLKGGARAYLISLPTPGTTGHPVYRLYFWSDTETDADNGSTTLVPYVQPAGYTYASPAPGRWMAPT